MSRLSLALGVFLLGGASLFASPKHGSVEHGHATFQSIAGGIEIHSGNKTIINWESFSIDAGEIARFCQSSSASAVLNRVIGSEQSLINGLLTSNGHVFLLNQNGILIGKDGVIDTAGFVASALDLSNDQFLKGGDFLFKGDGKGSVINLGTIHTRGGDVFLIGYHVSNEGTIQTDGGITGLASGAEVFLAVEGEERLFIRKGIDSEEIGASNDGVIRAAEVEIKASGNPFALAIKHGGEIEATGVAHRNGRVLLVADSGKTEVAGLVQAESGTVHVLGDEVSLTEAASIDVSGDVGGEVLIGGDYRGSNPEIPNSQRTYIYKGAEVRADGHHGEGGKVIFWGDEATHYYGDTSAAALGEVGDGGFVEVSAKSNDYIFKGTVNASSLNGAKGKLFLDPPRIRVRNAPPTNPPFPTTAPGTYMPVPPPNTADLNPASFVPVLDAGTDVIIDSTAPGGGNGDIDFEDSFSWVGAGNLSATAFRNITVTGGTTIQSASGHITFTAQGNGGSNNGGININGSLITTNGVITLDGSSTGGGGGNVVGVDVNGTITTVDGPISITGVSHGTGSTTHGIDIAGTISSTGTGTITFDGTGSTSGSANSVGVNLEGATVSSNSGLIDITGVAGTGISENQGIWIGNSASVTSTTGGITMDGTGGGTGSQNHGIEITDSGLVRSITLGDINLTGTTTTGNSFNTDGILMIQSGEVRSEGSGNIMMTGIGQAPGIALGELSGIDIINGDVIATGTGNIDLIGHCNANSEFSEGVKFQGTSSISSTSGKITITGSNTSNLQESQGVAFESSTTAIQTTGGDIEISGTSSMGDTTSYGFFMPNGSTISTTGSGSIEITGDIASGTGTTGQNGVEISGASTSVTTVNGDITVTGRSGGTSGSSYGVLLTSSSTVQSTGSGNVTLDGTSRATGGSGNVGVEIDGSSTLSGSGGIVSITGVGGMGSSGNHGVALPLPAAGTVTSPAGLVLDGTSQDGDNSIGVLIPATVPVSVLGAGNITITGHANGSGLNSHGVQIDDDLTTVTGNIQIDGTSTGDTTSNGIAISNVNVTTTGSGQITMTGDVASGTGTTAQNGVDLDGTSVSTVNGALSITGLSGGTSGSSYGVLLTSSSTVQSTGSGNVTLDGTSRATGGSGNVGVQVDGNSTLSGAGGVVSMVGIGGMGTSGNHGVVLPTPATATVLSPGGLTLDGTSSSGTTSIGVWIPTGATALTSGAGAITITGNATGIGTGSDAVLIEGNVTASGSGAVSINGTSNGDASHGIFADGNVSAGVGGITFVGISTGTGISDAIIVEGIVSTTSTGPLSLTGTVSGSSGTSDGIDIRLGGRVNSVDGAIDLMGTSNGVGGECTGIEIQQNGGVQSTGSGSITLTGVGSTTGTDEARGVKVTAIAGAPSFISVNNGNLIINGTGNGTTTENEGFLLGIPGDLGSFVTSTGAGNITINGTGSSTGTTENAGVRITGGLSVTSSGSGNITFVGQGGAGNDGYGVFVEAGSDVTASGAGAISLTGTAGTGSGNTYGVYITDASSIVTSNSGNVSLDGTGGSGAGGSHNVGAFIENGGTLSSTSGVVSITGVGGNGTTLNHGVELVTTGTVTSPGGLVLMGTSSQGTDSRGVLLPVGITALTMGTGNISITGNATGTSTGNHGVEILGAVDSQGTGTVTITGTTTGTSSRAVLIDGSTTGTVDATSGAVSITGTNTSAAGSDNAGIDLTSGAVLTTTGGSVTFNGSGGTGSDGYGVVIQGGAQVNVGGAGTATITGVSGSGSGNNYGVYLDSASSQVTTNSGNLTISGTSNSGGGSHNVGAFIENGGTLSSTSGVVSITGVGGNGTTLNHGVELVTTGTVTSPGGLVLDGTSSSGTNSRGVLLAPAITAQTAGAGNISITGVSSAGTGSPAVEIGGTVTTPGTGTITIQGTSSGSAATSPGVFVTSGTVSSTSGNITLTGTGNTGAALSEGVSLNAASISATGGNIGLTGTGQDASGSPVGIAVAGGSSLSTTGLGTMTLTTTAGDFTDSGVAANTYDSQQGAFSLTSAGAVLFSAGLTSTITTTLGSASITANGGNIILDDSGSVTTGGGTANLTATSGAIQLGVVDVTNTGDIFITASGTVTDNSAALVNLIGNRCYISSGGTGPLPTSLNQFQGVTPTIGSIDLTNGQALELIAWNIPGNAVQTASNGSIAIVTSAGGITVTNDVIADGAGLVGLDASAGPGAISVLEDVSSGSGAITIIGGSVTHSVNGNLATGGGVIDVTATSGNITMNPGTSYSTGGGNALLVASNSALLNLINAGAGDINVTATAGTITNNSGLNSPAILVGNQGTLTSALGAGTGTSSDNTAIGTSLTQLNGSVTGGSGGIIIFEQGGLNLGNISAPAGTLDINALNAITQVAGNILATDALFTTRAGNIGTVNVVNTSSILLEASLAAGDLSIDVGGNTLTLNGNTDVGGNYTVLAGTYDKGTFNVRVGGNTTTPVPINPLNTVTASGLLDDFDISSVTLASSGNITVNLRGETYNVGNPQGANAIIINSAGNTITSSLTVTTVDPNLSPQQKDYNLVNTTPVLLNPMQHFIVNAAKGQNFTPGVVNPKSSPFDNSPLNGFNGSTVNILNVVPSDNVFPGWVSIRDSYTTVFEAGPNLSTEYVNTYGDLTIRTTTGAIMTGATGETMRTGGALLTIESHGNLSIAGTVSNLTIPPVPLALNGIISYTSAIGSITGPALTQAAQVKLDAATGIGTGGQDLQINTPQVVFTAANDALIELSGAATVAGDSTSGAIDIETSGAGNLTIGSLTIDGLSRVGLTSSGVSGTQVVTTGGDILVNQAVTGNGGPIQLIASGAVTHGVSGNLTTTGVNAINVIATSGAITMDPTTVYTTGNGFASLNAHTNIEVAQINVGTADIFLNSTTGGVVKVTGPPTNLIGGRGYALASSGIGASGNSLQTNLSEFQGRVALAGDIYLLDTLGGLQLTDWNINPGTGFSAQTNSGDIDIQTNPGDLTVVRPVVAGGAGTINLVTNTAGSVALNQTVTSNTGSITITGATNVTHGGSGTVTVSSGASGTVTETASGDITMDPASMIVTQGGVGILSAILSAGTNVVVSNVNVAAGDVSVTATGGVITRAGAGPNLIGGRGYCTSATGVGVSATPIRSTLTEFQAMTTGIGPIALQETNAINLTDWNSPGNSVQTTNGLIQIETQTGNLSVTDPVVAGASSNLALTATAGSIVNGSGANSPQILTGGQATLTAQSGIGSGLSTDPTAIGTSIDTLIATVTAPGNVVIFEQAAIDLGAISLNNGTVDVNANGLIQQIAGNPVLSAAHAIFTTSRNGTIGTANVVNGGSATLNSSVLAGSLSIDVGANTLTLGGNSEVGINYTVVAGSYVLNGFQVDVGGTTTTPSPTVGNTVIASAATNDFDLSSVILPATNPITVQLRGTEVTNVANPQVANAILINSTSNSIAQTLTLTTVDPVITTGNKDYNLNNSAAITLNAGQMLTINAARGNNFTAIGNPNDSPFGGSPLNLGNGSNVSLTNVGPSNSFPEWVSIRDPFTATLESGPNLSIQYVNTYGDLQITSANGAVTTGAASQTVRAAGTNLRINAAMSITVDGAVSNLTPPPGIPALNGNLSYTTTGGSVQGAALSQASNIKISAVAGGIGTGAQDLQLTTDNAVFETQSNAFIDLSTAALIAGSSTNGGIDIGTSGAGNLTIDTVTVDGLNKVGLTSGGVTGIQVATPPGGDILVNQAVLATNAPIQLTANGAVTHAAAGDLTTTGVGTITVNANAGNLTMVDGTVFTTAGGSAILAASNSVQLSQVSTSGGNIFVTAIAGNISRVGASINLIGGNAFCSAATGIGAVGTSILSTLTQFQGTVTGPGDLYLFESTGVQLTNWNGGTNSVQTNSGDIDIQTQNGTLSVLAPVVAGGAGTINLDSNMADVSLGAAVSTNTGSITIMGDTNVAHQAGGNVSVTSGAGGTVSETATTGSVTMNGASSITTQGGNVVVTAAGLISVSAINAAAGDIFLTATTGNISRVAGPAVNLTGNKAEALAATGIGASGNVLQSMLTEFQGSVTGTGDVYLFDTAGGLQLTNLGGNSVETNDGSIDIRTGAGTLTVVDPVVAGGTGTINLHAQAANVLLSESVTSNSGSITIVGNTNVTHQTLGNVLVAVGGGTVTETATNGNLTMDGASSISTQGGNVTLNAGSSIAVSEVNAAAGNILMTATTGNISRVAGPLVNLIGANGFASAQTGVGTGGNILQSTLNQFQGIVGGTGGIFLNDTDALQLTTWNGGTNSVQTNSGAIDIQTASGSLTVAQPVVAGGSGTIKLDANADAVVVNQTVTSNTGSIQIFSQTGVSHGMNGTVMVSSGAAGTINVLANTGDISMHGNAKIITQGGNIVLAAQNDLNVAEVNSGATGQISAIATNGMITDTTGTLFLPNFVSNEVILQANTGIGSGIPSPSSTTDISTVANFLTASTVTNDIVISELNGLTLRDIITQNGGNFFLEAGGLVNQDGASTLQIDGNLTVVTSRASTLGTVSIVNSVNTDLGESEIAGNYTVNVTGNLSLSGDQFVGLDCDFQHTGTYTEAPFKVFHGGSYNVNGVDPDLQGPVINATGPTPNFNLDLAMPLSADPTITINLQGGIDTFNNTHLPDAIILTQAGNTINGTIDIQTVDPMYQGTTPINYHLIQTATPFTLIAGQTLIINAVRGTANPNVSGVLGSPYSGLVDGSNLGSNITLNLANTSNGVISIRDPNLCTLNVNGNTLFSHVNTFNDLTIEATAPASSITTGAFAQAVRSSGSLLRFTADQDITLNQAVNALSTGGAPFGEIVYTANNGSISGAGPSQAVGVSFIAPLGGVTTVTQATNCIFSAMTGVDILNANTTGNFGGTVSGSLTITQVGAGDLRVNSVTIDGVTRTGLTALDQTVNLTNNAGAITQIAGNVNAGTTGTVNLSSVTGITGIGPSATFQTLSRDVLAINSTSGEVRVENRLNGSNALSSSVLLNNGPGNAAVGRNLYFSQVGGSSVDFQTVNANGTGSLLAISGSANMNFSGNVNMGDSVIAVANHNMEVGGVQFNLNTPNAVATLILDQESPTLPGSGTFVNAGMFNISSGNLAIYAASGPQAPAAAIFDPPNQVTLGSLAPLAIWDAGEPNGLDTKYATSYSGGGPYHGPGFGTNYTPGNGVFGSQVIWYKFDVDHAPPSPASPAASGRIPFDPRIGINAWEVEYFLQYWDVNLNRLGGPNVPVMLVEENFETEPSSYRPHRSAIDNLREKVSTK